MLFDIVGIILAFNLAYAIYNLIPGHVLILWPLEKVGLLVLLTLVNIGCFIAVSLYESTLAAGRYFDLTKRRGIKRPVLDKQKGRFFLSNRPSDMLPFEKQTKGTFLFVYKL